MDSFSAVQANKSYAIWSCFINFSALQKDVANCEHIEYQCWAKYLWRKFIDDLTLTRIENYLFFYKIKIKDSQQNNFLFAKIF